MNKFLSHLSECTHMDIVKFTDYRAVPDTLIWAVITDINGWYYFIAKDKNQQRFQIFTIVHKDNFMRKYLTDDYVIGPVVDNVIYPKWENKITNLKELYETKTETQFAENLKMVQQFLVVGKFFKLNEKIIMNGVQDKLLLQKLVLMLVN